MDFDPSKPFEIMKGKKAGDIIKPSDFDKGLYYEFAILRRKIGMGAGGLGHLKQIDHDPETYEIVTIPWQNL